MANALYAGYKQQVWGDGAITGFSTPDLEGGDQRIILVDSADYTVVIATDQDLADVPSIGRTAVVALANESVVNTAGTVKYDSDDATFTAVTGDQSELIVLYEHTGTEATSMLIAVFDTFASGMPVTPNGGDILVAVNAAGWMSW